MDNFRIIFKILKILEKAMDFEEFDIELLSPDVLGITKERRDAILKMLFESGYIEGIAEVRTIGTSGIKLVNPRITLKGLEYLEENSIMRKAANLAKGAIDLIK